MRGSNHIYDKKKLCKNDTDFFYFQISLVIFPSSANIKIGKFSLYITFGVLDFLTSKF